MLAQGPRGTPKSAPHHRVAPPPQGPPSSDLFFPAGLWGRDEHQPGEPGGVRGRGGLLAPFRRCAGAAQRRGGRRGRFLEGGDTVPWHVAGGLRAPMGAPRRYRRTTATGTCTRLSTGTWALTGHCWRPPAACAGTPPSMSSVALGTQGTSRGGLGDGDTGQRCRQGEGMLWVGIGGCWVALGEWDTAGSRWGDRG